MNPASRQWLTRAQPATIAAAAALVRGALPHAVLISGPPAVGKTTLAEDIATGLLCLATDPAERPCRQCRGCRLVAAGNHPDLHHLAPEGPGGQIVIGDSGRASPRGVRNLVGELAYLPVEGGHRVAIVEHADRMNEDAQNALLKTLEEPPPAVTLILCADEQDRLLPTVRSRCVQLRVAPLGTRAIEELLAELSLADAPAAARLARIAGGRPGLAIAYARSAEAVMIRDEIARSLLDLLGAPSATRLTTGRELIERASALDSALRPVLVPDQAAGGAAGRGKGRGATGRRSPLAADPIESGGDNDEGEPADEAAGPARRPAAERRRAVLALFGIWRELALDLAIAGLGGRAEIRDPALLDDLLDAAAGVDPQAVGQFLVRLDRLAELVEGNAGPELALDVLILAWPRAADRAA